jgi:HEPN domain-containing protein
MRANKRVVELAAAWWRKAAEDLAVARGNRRYPTARCFHAQQAVEKAIKSLLTLHQIRFPKLHNISELLELLRHSPAPPQGLDEEGLARLTRFAVDVRYPPGDATAQDARDSYRTAKNFLLWVRQRLPKSI